MLRVPTIEGVIDRRILVNYHVDPQAIARILPPPFEPHMVDGKAIAGICLIRLTHIRPKGFPGCLGIRSENAAHRIAVQWTERGERRQGVYIPRRDTDSRLNALAGGRVFPGVHHHARFSVDESDTRYAVKMVSDDGAARVEVVGQPAGTLPGRSVFHSLDDASLFFVGGSIGYSPAADRVGFDGLRLDCRTWSVTPLDLSHVYSSFFENNEQFTPDEVEFDCALLMKGIEHQWHTQTSLCCDPLEVG